MSEGAKGWVDLTLPSQGYFYGNAIPEGRIQIRKMTVAEVAAMQTQGMDATQRLTTVIANASKFPNNFPPSKLLLTDRQAILLYQRALSVGPSYMFTYRCPGCKATVKHTVDIIKDLIEVTGDAVAEKLHEMGKECVEPFSLELPDEKIVVELRFLRGDDEATIFKRAKQGRLQNLDPTDPSAIIRLALMIQTINGETVDVLTKERMVRGMNLSDMLLIEQEVELRETGLDTTVYPVCTACGQDLAEGMTMPFDREFFRPTAPANYEPSGSRVLPAIPRQGIHGAGDLRNVGGRDASLREPTAQAVDGGSESAGTGST